MMFSGVTLKHNKNAVRLLAMVLLAAIIVANVLDIRSVSFFSIDLKGMLLFDSYASLFTLSISFADNSNKINVHK